MVSYDARNAILIDGTRLVGTDVAAAAAGGVLLVEGKFPLLSRLK